jgi:hypothetical protein
MQVPKQSRHPERSASQIYRKQRTLWRGVEEPVLSVAEGTPAMLISPCCPELFNYGPSTVFPGAESQELAGILRIAADLVVGLLWSKSLG